MSFDNDLNGFDHPDLCLVLLCVCPDREPFSGVSVQVEQDRLLRVVDLLG